MNSLRIRFITTIVIIWVLDFITKIWAVKALSPEAGPTINVISDLLRFRLIYNTGGVFGIFQNNPMFFQILTGIAIIFLVIYYLRTPESNRLFHTAISFVLGGAFGNFTDRFFRKGVVDFIDMGIGNHRWPTYNVADAFISVGAVLLVIAFIQIEKQAKKAEQAETPLNSSEDS